MGNVVQLVPGAGDSGEGGVEPQTFEVFFTGNKRALSSYLRRNMASETDVQDIVQESYELVDPASQVSWSKGFHVFAATPLREAIAEINRYSLIDLTLADPSAGQLLVSGSFKLGDGRAVAEALPYALPVKVSERGGSLVISKR